MPKPATFNEINDLAYGFMERVRRHLASAAFVPLRRDFYVFDLAGSRWNREAVLTHTFEMELDGLSDLGFDFSDGCTRGYTTW